MNYRIQFSRCHLSLAAPNLTLAYYIGINMRFSLPLVISSFIIGVSCAGYYSPSCGSQVSRRLFSVTNLWTAINSSWFLHKQFLSFVNH
jgi:hypothetical protein